MDSQDKMVFSGSLCLLSFLGWLFFVLEKRNLEKSKKFVEKGFVWSPNALIRVLEKMKNNKLSTELQSNSKQAYQRMEESSYQIKFDAIVEGLLTSNKAFRSKVNPSMQVVYSQIEVSKIHPSSNIYDQTFGRLFEKQRVFLPSQKMWFLEELAKNKKETQLQGLSILYRPDVYLDPKIFKVLHSETVYHEMSPLKRSLIQIGQLISLASASLLSLFTNSFEIGFTSKELVIKTLTPVILYGRFVFNKKTKQLTCIQPFMVLANRNSAKKINKFLGLGYTTAAFFCASFFIFSLFKTHQHYKALQSDLDRLKRIEKADKAIYHAKNEEELCIICVTKPKKVLFYPCMHFSICKDCWLQVRKDECPICKTPILFTKILVVS